MNAIFTVLMVLVAIVMIAVMLDAVFSVSRKPSWVVEANEVVQLTVVTGSDRREGLLPFVGAERRKVSVAMADLKKAA